MFFGGSEEFWGFMLILEVVLLIFNLFEDFLFLEGSLDFCFREGVLELGGNGFFKGILVDGWFCDEEGDSEEKEDDFDCELFFGLEV